MQTSLFQIVISVIEALNATNATLKEQEQAIKDLNGLIKLVFNGEDQQEVERELFSIAQQCRAALNERSFTLAMELLEKYMG